VPQIFPDTSSAFEPLTGVGSGHYNLGATNATLKVTNEKGMSDTCSANVTVVVRHDSSSIAYHSRCTITGMGSFVVFLNFSYKKPKSKKLQKITSIALNTMTPDVPSLERDPVHGPVQANYKRSLFCLTNGTNRSRFYLLDM
jgi:hypothetical protein